MLITPPRLLQSDGSSSHCHWQGELKIELIFWSNFYLDPHGDLYHCLYLDLNLHVLLMLQAKYNCISIAGSQEEDF